MSWKWETFEALVQPPLFEVSDTGPLQAPIRSFKIYRNEKFELTLEASGPGSVRQVPQPYPAGTVRVSSEQVKFSSQAGFTGKATGLIPTSVNGTWRPDGESEVTQTARFSSLEVTLKPGAEPVYVIDWIANLDASGVWTGSQVSDKKETTETRTVGDGANPFELIAKREGLSFSNSSLRLCVAGVEFFVVATKLDAENTVRRPGYIIYHGEPGADFRKKIWNVLSFCLGNCLLHLGSTNIDEGGELVSLHAVSPHDFDGRIFEIPSSPPSPLGPLYEHHVDQNILSRMVEALFQKYDELRFGELSWAYWHAVCAPVHMAANHFGAAIEALQEAYAASQADRFSTKLIEDKGKFSDLREDLSEVVAGYELNDLEKRVLLNKISNLNNLPQGMKSDRILSHMGLALGPMETAAWQRRNSAAHGKAVDQQSGVAVIRETKILKLILDRMILKISGANDQYYDYYTISRPIRRVAESVPPEVSTDQNALQRIGTSGTEDA